jgi:hypothetical protein
MKNTKIMIAAIVTFLMTWLFLGVMGWLLSDASIRECMLNTGCIGFMMVFGWVPAFVVSMDLEDSIRKDNRL